MSLEAPNAAPIQFLWHYTSTDSFLKILETRTLFASNVRYLNDAGEFKILRERILHILRAEVIPAAEPSQEDPTGVVRSAWQTLVAWGGITVPPNIYVACLSEVADQLSQWRAYRREGPGVAIGFDVGRLKQIAGAQGFELRRCRYVDTRAAHAEILSLLVSAVKAKESVIRSAANLDDKGRAALVLGLARSAWAAFVTLAVTEKHNGFEEENEVRLVKELAQGEFSGIHVRSAHGALIPTISIHFGARPESFPAARIWLGPEADSAAQDMTLNAVRIALGVAGVELTDVRTSETPLRS